MDILEEKKQKSGCNKKFIKMVILVYNNNQQQRHCAQSHSPDMFSVFNKVNSDFHLKILNLDILSPISSPF